jgi:subtilisin family serine protease
MLMKYVGIHRNNRLLTLAGAIAVTLCSGASASSPYSAAYELKLATAISATAVVTEHTAAEKLHVTVMNSGIQRYTVVLKESPLATYDGAVAGLARIGRDQKGHLQVRSAEATNYVNYLAGRQNQFLNDVSAQLGRTVKPIMQFQHAINGVVVELSSEEAADLAKRDDVMLVDPERMQPLMTNRSTFFIGANTIWDGTATGGILSQGEGVVVGDIDSGINFTSPSFAGVGPVDGYQHINPLGAGTYLGLCKPGGVDEGHCTDKLIGLYDFVNAVCVANGCGAVGTFVEEPSATDSNGHGSHTASTAVGNHSQVTLSGGTFEISGVAPHASIVAYDACYTRVSDGGGLCPTTSTTASANQAVVDGIVDVLTFSIGGGTSPWTDSTSLAFLGAQNAGIFIAAAAGNDGPATAAVSHVEPWVATAAASTDDQVLGYTFNLNGPGTPPANTVNLAVHPGANPQPAGDLVNLPITRSPGFDNGNNDGCAAFASAHTFDRDVTLAEQIFADGFEGTPPPPIVVKGIAVLHLDGNNSACGSGARRINALAAGASAVIFVDVPFLNLGAADTSYAMTFDEWNPVYTQISTDPANATASIVLPLKSFLTGVGDVIADFSSRGPAAGLGGQAIVKPEIAAPGVGILAAYMGLPGAVALEDGTSMSTPHIAGAAALLRSLHPTWTSTQLRSAMMLTAKTDTLVKQDGTPASIWERGAGRIDLSAAAKASLILDETGANYLAANPATGGKISTLNLPSMAESNCVGTCTFTRTVRSAHVGGLTYTLTVDGLPAGTATVAPTSFTLSTSGTKSFTVTVNGALLPASVYQLGQVTLTPSDPNVPVQHLPLAVKPGGPAIGLSANQVSATQTSGAGVVTKPLVITNTGNPTLNWMIGTGTPAVTMLNTATTTNGDGPFGQYTNPANDFYGAQNFDVVGTVKVTTLRANGFLFPSGTLSTTNTSQVTFSVYNDSPGVPTGGPEGFGAAPVWTYAAAGNGSGVSIAQSNIGLNLSAAGVPALNLSSGRYWFVAYPTMNSTGDGDSAANPGWAWRVSSAAQVGNTPQVIDPSSASPAWEPLTGVSALSAVVQGTAACAQPAWVSYAPTSDALGFGASSNMTITFDPTGLAAGTYNGNLCIASNATNTPTAVVGLTFTVNPAPTHTVISSVGTPSGSITPLGTQTVNTGDTAVFTLAADPGFHIDTVGGTCNGSLLTNTFTTNAVNADCTVIANFAPDVPVTHNVISSVGAGTGTITPLGSQPINDGTTTQFTLAPGGGFHVDTVDGTCGGSLAGNIYTTHAITVDCTVIANFAADLAPTLTKGFSPNSVTVGGTSTLTITFGNANASNATLSAALVDVFPSGVVVAATPNASTTCTNAALAINGGDASVTLPNAAQIPSGGCTLHVDVTSATANAYTNTLAAGSLQTTSGNNADPASAVLTVTAAAAVCHVQPLKDPSFETTSNLQANTFWTTTSANSPNNSPLCSVGLCGAALSHSGDFYSWFGGYTGVAESSSITQSVTLESGSARNLNFWMLRQRGTATNGQLVVKIDSTTLQTYPRPAASDTAFVQYSLPIPTTFSDGASHTVSYAYTVTASTGQTTGSFFVDDVTLDCASGGQTAPTIAKSFSAQSTPANTPVTLTLTLGNVNTAATTLSAPLVDTFPSGLVIAPAPNSSSTCAGGALTATAGAGSVTLGTGAVIPASGTCIVKLDVQSPTEKVYVNKIGYATLHTDIGSNDFIGKAQLIVGSPVLTSGTIHHAIPHDGDGLEMDFQSGTITDGFTGGSGDWNPFYVASGLANFWEFVGSGGVATSTGASGKYVVLHSGATIGPASIFNTGQGGCTGTGGNNSNFCATVDGYMGFRFTGCTTSPSGTCYGYVHLTTTATTGDPAFIEDYAFDRLGNAITIP